MDAAVYVGLSEFQHELLPMLGGMAIAFICGHTFQHMAQGRSAQRRRTCEPGGGGTAGDGPCLMDELPDDTIVRMCGFLGSMELAVLRGVSRRLRRTAACPSLWQRVTVPDGAPSLQAALRAIPASVAGRVVIALRPGVYVDGQRDEPRQQGRPARQGIVVHRLVSIEPCAPGDKVTLRSARGDVVTFGQGSQGSRILGCRVQADLFAAHALVVRAPDVRIAACELVARGRASYGIVFAFKGGPGAVEGCTIHECGGGGVLCAHDVGPVDISDSQIADNLWSGVSLFSGASAELRGCTVSGNRGYGVLRARDAALVLGADCDLERNEQGRVHSQLSVVL